MNKNSLHPNAIPAGMPDDAALRELLAETLAAVTGGADTIAVLSEGLVQELLISDELASKARS